MDCGEENIVKIEGNNLKVEKHDRKTEEISVKTEEFQHSVVVDKVKSEYNEYHGQYLISDQIINIKIEPNLSDDDASQEVIQRKQAASESIVAEHVANRHNLKPENITLVCIQCFEKFSHEQEYNAHMLKHLKTSDADSECVTSQVCRPHTAVSSGRDSAHIIEHKHAVQSLYDDSRPSAGLIQHSATPLPAQFATKEDFTIKENKQGLKDELHNQLSESNNTTKTNVIITNPKRSKKCISSCNRLNVDAASTKSHCLATSKSDVTVTRNISESEKPYSCQICEYKCARKNRLMIHMRNHTGEKPFSCNLCDFKCTLNGNLVRHMRTHTGEKPYSCELCEYKCTQKGTLLLHMRRHTGEKPYTCDVCMLKFAKKWYLVSHMRTHTGEKPYSCELCEYKCAHKINLVIHMRTHTGEKPYVCNLCEFKCNKKYKLVHHMRTHTGEKPYACNVCDFKCTQKGNLSSHMRRHTGEKPYSCEICVYKCTLKNSLKLHMRTHTGEKPYACNVCEFKCSQNGALKLHKQTHSAVKSYSCKVCKYTSATSSALGSHMRRTHPG